MSTIARLLVELGMDASGFTQGVAAAQAKTQALGSSLTGFGKRMTAAVSLPLAGLGGLALNAAGGFEQAMNQMAVVSGATAQEMAQIEAEALRLGAATSFSAGEAADAMLELAKAGLSPQETLAAASGVLDLAAAGGLDLADAAEVAANSVNAFGLAAADTAGVANMLAAAANASSVDVSDLSEAFKMSASVFAANGQSVGDLTAALAVLGNNALKGSDAGTSLKTMLMRLSAPTDEAAAALASLGVSVYGADGSMRGFADILADLERGTANLSDEQRNAALSTIFGADAIRAATILLKEGTAGFGEMAAAVSKQGAAAEVAGARMSGLTGSFQYFLGSVESTLIAAVLPFTEGIAGLVRSAGDLIASFGSLPAPVQGAAVAFAAAAAAVGPVALGLGAVISFAGAALAPIAALAAGVGVLAAVFASDFLGIRTAAVQTWDALTHLWAAVSGAGPASGEAQAALALFPSFLQPLGALALSAASGFQFLSERWAAAAALFASGGVTVSGVLGELGAVLLGAGGGMQQTAGGVHALAAALTGSQAAADAFAAGLGGVGAATAGMAQGLGAAWAQLVGLLAPGLARVQAAFAGVQAQTSSLAPAFEQLLAAAQTLWAALAPILQAVGGAFGAALAVTAVGAVNGLSAALERIVPVAAVVVSQIAASLTFAAQTVTNAAALVRAVIDGDWAAAWDAAGRLVGGAATFITTTFSNLSTVAQEVFGGILDTVTTTLADLGVNVEGTLAGVKRTWDGVWGALSAAVQPVIDTVTAFRRALDDFRSWLGGVSFPNPFAGWSMPSLPSLPNPFGGGGEPVGQNAGGTNFWRGGLTWVGERGPELVDLPRGSRVFPADVSQRIAQNAAGGAGVVTTTLTDLGVQETGDAVWGSLSGAGAAMTPLTTTLTTLTDLGVKVKGTPAGVQRTGNTLWGGLGSAAQPVADIVDGLRQTLAAFGSWLSGLTFPRPFADWSMPSLPSLPSLRNPFGGGEEPVGRNARGTAFWRGGLTWVGERGPELVDLPRGSRVFPADVSQRMAQNAAGSGAGVVTTTLPDLGVLGVQQPRDAVLGSLSSAAQPVTDILYGFRRALDDFGSWLSGLTFPRPFADWSMLSLPSLPSLRNPFGGGEEPVGRNAGGTAFWRGGLTWVGEQGPELVDLPRGSRVFPADVSQRMAQDAAGGAGAGAGPQVNIYATVRDELDIHELAYQVAAEIRRWRR